MSTQTNTKVVAFNTSTADTNNHEIELRTKTESTSTKNTVKSLLYIWNLISFIISIIMLCASFPEIIQQCVNDRCDLSVANATYPICHLDGYDECDARINYDIYYVPYRITNKTCSDMITDYGCDCNSIATEQLSLSCRGVTVDYDTSTYSLNEDDVSKCESYSCTTYCFEFCTRLKYTLIILVVLVEFFIGIPTKESIATKWSDELEETGIFKCCCKSRRKANAYIKMVQFLTNWMVNFALYQFRGAVIGELAHFDWMWIGMLCFYILTFGVMFKKKDELDDSGRCSLKCACNWFDYVAKVIMPYFGYTFLIIFVTLGWGYVDRVTLSFRVLFDFDFEMKLFIGLHTITLLMTQIVSNVRNVINMGCDF